MLSLVAPVSPEPLEPLDWTPAPRFRDRVLAAVGTPVVVGVVCFAFAVAVAVIIALMQPHAPDVEAGADPAADPVAGSATAADSAAQTSVVEPSAQLLVHVIGKVRSPGVVELPVGSRVQDAIEAAGGATSRAALSALNLARLVVDGEQIVVAKRRTAGASAADTGPGVASTDGSGSADAVLDLNAADASALEQLPRIGPALAQRIVDWRNAHGRFGSVEQLLQVSGIGAKTLDGFRDR
ncbi:MAG: ComEA family DNA-binding protein, partial [Actinobacteria bacterium]|nr:ComEA family DNA-binding protein [Actinomycetota bacterium]